MEMNIELDCPNCVRNVFVAIGEFLCQDDGPSTIVAVDVFDTEDNEGEVGVGVVIRSERRRWHVWRIVCASRRRERRRGGQERPAR